MKALILDPLAPAAADSLAEEHFRGAGAHNLERLDALRLSRTGARLPNEARRPLLSAYHPLFRTAGYTTFVERRYDIRRIVPEDADDLVRWADAFYNWTERSIRP